MDFKYSDNKIYLEDENGKEIAYVLFPKENDALVNITNTVVDPSLQGQGIASKLLKELSNYLKKEKLKTIVSCSYAVKRYMNHKEFHHLLYDIDEVKRQADILQGPACGINHK